MRCFREKKVFALLVLVLLLSFTCTSCSGPKQNLDSINTKLKQTAQAVEFANYQDFEADLVLEVKPYQIAADMSNVENRDRFEFSPGAKELLIKNNFVVAPGSGEEFFVIYEPNRYDGIPNFVTTDAMLHNYHLFFNHLLERIEQDGMVSELKQLNNVMLNESQAQYDSLKNSSWENAARRNLAFFTVGSLLLDPQTKVPAPVKQEVEEEMNLIKEHKNISLSPIMNMGQDKQDVLEGLKEDYTQYITRGHYNKSEELQNYFKTMMWYGRMSFRLKNEDETRSAVLISLALNQNNNLQSWQRIYEPTCFFVGKSDDLGFYQYNQLLNKIYGSEIKLQDLTEHQEKWRIFMNETELLKAPNINSIPIFDENIQPDREKEIKAFRFLGQRYTLDASVFQRLIYREVKENPEGALRTLPRGLDIPAAMGSTEACSILEELGDTRYQNYPENMEKIQAFIKGLDKNTWNQNLYWSWLYTLLPLTIEKGEGYPSFMDNQAWSRKELNTYLGSWTELKHDTILYAKQVYAECGGGGEEIIDDRGYVEPNPQLYARLASLAGMTREGLLSRQLLYERDASSLERMEKLALALRDISDKELKNEALSDEDYELIRCFGGQLEHFWLEALRNDDVNARCQLCDNPAALVADVATTPRDGLVLEEGSGFISEIYAVFPVDGKLRIGRGGVYSYYEFPWPISDRLTDKKWQEMLRNETAPQLPEWTASFTAPGPCRIMYSWE